jgi:hypothetical protein
MSVPRLRRVRWSRGTPAAVRTPVADDPLGSADMGRTGDPSSPARVLKCIVSNVFHAPLCHAVSSKG